jgi:hypothetical protein
MQSTVLETISAPQVELNYRCSQGELKNMTLVVAATNGKAIVVGADSHVYEGSDDSGLGTYRSYERPKLRTVNGNRWIIGFSGLGDVAATVLDHVEATMTDEFSFDIRVGVLDLTRRMGEAYRQFRLPGNADILLAGFSGEQPRIYRWKIQSPNPTGGDAPPWGGIGCGVDVALHFVRSCEPLVELNAEQLAALVYFSISEVASSDLRVKKPIDIAVNTPKGAQIWSRDSVLPLEELSGRLTKLIRERILNP